MKKLLALAAIFAATTTATAHAELPSKSGITVSYVLCAASGYCNVYFESKLGSTCTRDDDNAVRFEASSAAGQNMLSVLQMAYLSGRKVKVTWDGCAATSGGSYPKLEAAQAL